MTANTPIALRLYESDRQRLVNIMQYLEEKEPQNQITITDAIRYALFCADQGIENEELKATIRLMEQESGLDAPLR